MEPIILLLAGLLALTVIYFKIKKMANLMQNIPENRICDCGICSASCPVKEMAATLRDKADNLDPSLLQENNSNGTSDNRNEFNSKD